MAQGHKTLANVFENEAATFTKVVAGFTVPVRAMFHEGEPLTALQARALSAYHLERGASVANSNIDRGAWSKLDDAGKIAKASEYLSGKGEAAYVFTDTIGGEVFGASLLEQAAIIVLTNANKDKLGAMDPNVVRKELMEKGHVVRFLNSPDATAKYEDEIRATMAAILAERHEKKTRTAKTEAGGLEVSF